MTITPDTLVADIATAAPATIRVFQAHGIDFCCGGKVPLAAACAHRGLAVAPVLQALQAATAAADAPADWSRAATADLIAHIQRRYHAHLSTELPRLAAMLDRVVRRHGNRLPKVLRPLQAVFDRLQEELLDHMRREDEGLFPAVLALEAAETGPGTAGPRARLDRAIGALEAEHAAAGDALAAVRAITEGFTPPEDACPTFRGLYHGLADLERDMHVHVHLENNVLFPRAARLSGPSAAAAAADNQGAKS